MKCFFVFVLLACASCKTTTYYVVRHAEKEAGTTMTATTTKSSDVPLSAAGRERAEALKESLENKNIKYIFSTNTLRTRSTAKPLSDALSVTLRLYDAVDSNFERRRVLASLFNSVYVYSTCLWLLGEPRAAIFLWISPKDEEP